MAVVFNQAFKHGTEEFARNGVYAFGDADAEAYFRKAGVAAVAPIPSVPVLIPVGSITIDPTTVMGNGPKRGRRVMELEG